jgi:hypothetical protein
LSHSSILSVVGYHQLSLLFLHMEKSISRSLGFVGRTTNIQTRNNRAKNSLLRATSHRQMVRVRWMKGAGYWKIFMPPIRTLLHYREIQRSHNGVQTRSGLPHTYIKLKYLFLYMLSSGNSPLRGLQPPVRQEGRRGARQ